MDAIFLLVMAVITGVPALIIARRRCQGRTRATSRMRRALGRAIREDMEIGSAASVEFPVEPLTP